MPSLPLPLGVAFLGERMLLLGGTASQRRRAFVGEHGDLKFRDRDATGVKKIDVKVGRDGTFFRTPHGLKTVARRRAARKVAKQARKVNR